MRLWMQAALALLLATGAAPASAEGPPASVGARGEARLKSAARVADWQLGHMDDLSYVTKYRPESERPTEWVKATFYIGLTAFADATGERRYADAVIAHGRENNWSFGSRPRHADPDAIGAVWLWSAARTGDKGAIQPLKARFDAVLAAPSTADLAFVPRPGVGEPLCQTRWCWCDALFMSPPVWMELANATGDARYREHADREFWATTDYLYDKEEKLFYRDSRFFDQRGPNGRKVFWSRGNGWVFAGLPRILNALPKDHPSRPRYERLFKDMARRIKSLQGAEGYWPSSLLDPSPVPETSGTGFYVYGLAWGLNQGLLPAAEYRPAVEKGWSALERAIRPDGRLGYVQQIGDAPDHVEPDSTQLYGSGAFLLAASEVAKLP